MKTKNQIWSSRLFKGLILYAFISVSVGAVINPASTEDMTGAPSPESHDEPIVQVYAARTWGKKGMLAVHSWIATKRAGELFYTRHEIVGWQLRRSSSALRSRQWYAMTNLNGTVMKRFCWSIIVVPKLKR